VKPAIVLLILFSLASCGPAATLQSDVRTEHIRALTAVALPVERASAAAALRCSEEGLALLQRLNIETSRNARMSLLLDSLGNLSVDATFAPDTVFVASDSVVISRDVVRTEVEYRDRELSRWEMLKLEVGGWAIGAAGILVTGLVVWVVFKVKGKFF
jgi:hypothetical protein